MESSCLYISKFAAESRYAQIEKEALVVTWACDRLISYLLGLKFTIKTDHKPLISLLGSRALDDIPPRILHFRLRPLRFNYSIEHVTGKQLVTADMLSHAPLKMETLDDDLVERECNLFINQVNADIQATKTKLELIKEEQVLNVTCKQIRIFTGKDWPSHQRNVPEQHLPYWPDHHDIHIADDLLMKGDRVPKKMRQEILERFQKRQD